MYTAHREGGAFSFILFALTTMENISTNMRPAVDTGDYSMIRNLGLLTKMFALC